MKLGTKLLDFSRPYIVGVLNLTPDSFSDGGQFHLEKEALIRAEQLFLDGADFIEIGAESTRPGAALVSSEDEMTRLSSFLNAYTAHSNCPLILDTRKAVVAQYGLDHGVAAINDVSGFSFDKAIVDVVSKFQVPVILMHSQGTPDTMQDRPTYTDILKDVLSSLAASKEIALNAGISDIILDPGIGFGKTLDHNLCLLNHFEDLSSLECPTMIGTSRKSFIGTITGAEVDDRLEGTLVSSLLPVMKGANFVRVHDVKAMKRALQVYEAIIGVSHA